MSNLAQIPGITGPILELLEAAGFEGTGDLDARSPEEILAALERANEESVRVYDLPTVKTVSSWKRAAKSMTGRGGTASGPVSIAEAQRGSIRGAAIVPGQQLMEAGISVDDVPIARLVEAGVRKSKRPLRESIGPGGKPRPASPVANSVSAAPLQVERLKKLEDQPKRLHRERSKRNKGMSHHMPLAVWFGAVAALVAEVLFAAGLAGTVLLLGVAYVFSVKLPREAVVVPAIIPLALLLFLLLAAKPRCRLCGYRLFVPKQCLRHVNAHHWPGFGYIFPTALHAIFTWTFRCMFCGTKVSLAKKPVTPGAGSRSRS
jgi:hypothetical protein